MSMKLLPVDGAWVDAMISLADGPWTRQAVERLFVERGWIQAEDMGTIRVPWQMGGEVWPQLDLLVDSGPLTDDSAGAGWCLDLGAPPPDENAGEVDRHSFVAFSFALLWPPLGSEEPDMDEDDEDDLQEDYSAEWIRYPDAGAAEFEAEFHRVRALIEDRIGPPTRTVGDITTGLMREIWDRGRWRSHCRSKTTSRRTPSTTTSPSASGRSVRRRVPRTPERRDHEPASHRPAPSTSH